jgi:hypothetical protein
MAASSPKDLIVKTLKEKSVVKQDVFHQTISVFKLFKEALKEVADELSKKVSDVDERLVIEFTDKSEFEAELRVAGDVLLFYMHTNVFDFDKSHPIWKTSYVKNKEYNSLCGMINVYNFLSDSFKYNRTRDLGYLIARVFVNRELHYFVEGKRQLGFLYNNFSQDVLDKKAIRNVIESAILYCLDFDLFVPQFDAVKEVSVAEIQEATNAIQLKTAKRLGFRFMADSDEVGH